MAEKIISLDAHIEASASVVGKKEFDGPIGGCFDIHDEKNRFGMDTWEKAESEMQRMAFGLALGKKGLTEKDIGLLFAGDLLNQCVGSAYGLIDYDIPYLGLYGACSTAAESLLLASVFASNGIYERVGAVTSSHFCSSERQFRTPIEYGGQRTPTAQWTVTGSGAFVVRKGRGKNRICEGLPGVVVDMGVKDAANMGAAMAPAAANTLIRYFEDSGRTPSDFDLILTGDLGREGSDILCDLMENEGIDIRKNHNDCGKMIYLSSVDDTHSGGSGCGCSAVVMASYILPKIESGDIGDMLFLGTGALMSPDSIKQGQAIPGVAHLLRITSTEYSGDGNG